MHTMCIYLTSKEPWATEKRLVSDLQGDVIMSQSGVTLVTPINEFNRKAVDIWQTAVLENWRSADSVFDRQLPLIPAISLRD